MSTPDPDAVVFDALAFAARAHRHQVRKDGATPYFSHAARVALVVRHVFGIADPEVLAAAALHDTIEDTTTDYDDLAARFGSRVAGWVAALTKNSTLPEAAREADYMTRLTAAPWQVAACKFADIYDNLADSGGLSTAGREKAVTKSRAYLDAFRGRVPAEAAAAFAIVDARAAGIVAK